MTKTTKPLHSARSTQSLRSARGTIKEEHRYIPKQKATEIKAASAANRGSQTNRSSVGDDFSVRYGRETPRDGNHEPEVNADSDGFEDIDSDDLSDDDGHGGWLGMSASDLSARVPVPKSLDEKAIRKAWYQPHCPLLPS